ncbi:hypothetical protein CRG98_022851 [Punica granatum]|uniref:Uncharacterized protein n=1 Tax=Punica granatum TaxID=22663 RepID=A0A2I0JKJ3_PUNGR|nr:hypothetical protein CRG98_022851 [Punica granatum]
MAWSSKPRLFPKPDGSKGQHLSKNLSSSSPLLHFRPALTKAGTGQNHRKTVRYSGFGMFGTTHERLDSSLRSPTSPILHRAVVGASVPTPFSPSCRCRHLPTSPILHRAVVGASVPTPFSPSCRCRHLTGAHCP